MPIETGELMRRAVLIVLLVIPSAALADPGYQRYAVNATWTGLAESSVGEEDRTRLPGPGLAVDLMTMLSPRVGFGAHLAWNSSFNAETDTGTEPRRRTKQFDQLAQLHAQIELRQGRVAMGLGLGIDALHERVTSISDGSDTYSDTSWSLGGNLHLSIDIVSIDQGAFALVGAAGVFSSGAGLLGGVWPLYTCDLGEIGCDIGTTFSVGAAFRPR
jgi:hypothetical protein